MGSRFAALASALLVAASAQAAEPLTPPRLALVDGPVSFLRAGSGEWVSAQVNTPLAAGDRLYSGARGNLEIQVGGRAFVRAAENSELGIVNLEPDFLQLELKSGHASLDLRTLPPSATVELDTPNAAFTVEHPGYYRVIVEAGATHFISRRGGRATVLVEGAPAQAISPSEETVVSGPAGAATVATYVAPPLDDWDRWNYARTDDEIDALSARYVSTDVYGVASLDHYGTWRVVPEYGAVWVPEGVAAGWTPYSTGSWIWDPVYGWTWVDDAPWGWAPFHYGRWVYLDGYWAWAPGPLVVRPAYAPALVAFFGVSSGVSVSIGISGPALSWVALSWGEPLYPWWGPAGFIHRPWWGGWGGPRATTVVYRNLHVTHAVVVVSEKSFGGGPIRPHRYTVRERERERFQPLHGAISVKPGTHSYAPAVRAGTRPPAAVVSRSVVATRPAHVRPSGAPAPRIVAAPKGPSASPLPRPAFGARGTERPRPAQPPRYEEFRRTPGASAPRAATPRPSTPRAATPQAATPRSATPRAATPRAAPPRALPGRPANEVAPRGRAPSRSTPQRKQPERGAERR